MSTEMKKVLITGGKALADTFLKSSHAVTMLDINSDLLATARELSSLASIHDIECDIISELVVQIAMAESVNRYGDLDIVISNAGIMDRLEPVGDVDIDLVLFGQRV
ncbi:hypothetical protein BKA61DRAFT_733195 [Leptodontidium sp. MPI-SDFR-AT-0119]|nr:hypothetical protein BKA61DRAFT_733195 [Leptodontidium sp. MPI-SDFR-AT-0119]